MNKEETRTRKAPGRFRPAKVFARWWWLAILMVAAITYSIAMAPAWMGMAGPLYESSALVEVKPVPGEVTGNGKEATFERFIKTQREVITGGATLEAALAKNDLLSRLGGDQYGAAMQMRKSIRISQRRGTDLIEIAYRAEDPVVARDAATAVYEAYRDRRCDLEMKLRKGQLKAIKMELQNKEDRVAELRRRVMGIAEKSGIIWPETEDGGKVIDNAGALQNRAEKELYEAEREQEQIALQINKLSAVEDADLISVVAELPDVGFKEAFKLYEEAKNQIETMRASGVGKKHPSMLRQANLISEREKSLTKRAENVRETLKHRLTLVEGRVSKLRGVVNNLQYEGSEKARGMQEFNVARKEYQTAVSIMDQMRVKYDIEKTKTMLPPTNIIVHQIPELAAGTITRGRDFYAVLGAACSLPLSLGLGIILMYLAEMIFPRRVAED